MLIRVEIVYASSERQELTSIEIKEGATVADAIKQSSIADRFPDESIDDCVTGVWGRVVDKTRVLKNGDRVELYRQLSRDPREARRERAIESHD